MQQEQWESRYREQQVWSRDPNPWLLEVAAALTPGAALDVGCGEGADALWLAEHGWTVTALDFAPSALRLGRQRAEDLGGRRIIKKKKADIRTWRTKQRFDLVSVHFLHGPQPERTAALRRAWELTSGSLLVVGHDTTNATQGHGGPPAPVLYTAQDVLADLDVSGTQVRIAERRSRFTDDPDRIMWDCVVLLQR